MPVTIYEVARKAGVGIGTVSRVLNNSPQIAPATRDKVLKVIKELNFQPYALAQGLARRRTHTVGVIVSFFTGYFYVELLRGIQRALAPFKYGLTLYGVDHLQNKEVCLKRVLQERRVDGVLVLSLQISDYYAGEFLRRKLPLVLVDAFHPAHDSFTVDNEAGAYLAVKYLVELRHRRIALINGHLACAPARERQAGFLRALAEAGLEAPEHHLISSDGLGGEAAVLNDGFNKEAGYLAALRLLDHGGERPEAIFAASDIQAIGAIRAIRERGLQVPGDIAVVGFDDIELADLAGLTTMRQPITEMGKMAAQRLMAKINGEDGSERTHHRFTTSLVRRETCGAHLSL